VVAQHPEVVARLSAAYDRFVADLKKNKLPTEKGKAK
jgi:hypothetical protein